MTVTVLVLLLALLPNSFHAPASGAVVVASPVPFPGAAPMGLIGLLGGGRA